MKLELAQKLLDASLAQRLPNLRDIGNTRNRITHGYDSVSFPLLWDIVQQDIPRLESDLQLLLKRAPELPSESG